MDPRTELPAIAASQAARDQAQDVCISKLAGDLAAVPAVPAGGLTGQLLAKASDADHDAAWVNLPPSSTGNLTRKSIAAPIVAHDDAARTSDVAESEAVMNLYIYSYVGPSPAAVSDYGSGILHHADWAFNYSAEAAKHLDVSAIKLSGGYGIENAVLQSSALKPGDGGFTAEFLLQDGTNDITVEIDATPDIDYEGQLQFVYDWTIANNGANSYYAQISAITGVTVLEHTVTFAGVEVHFDFGGEAFGGLDDFELVASVSFVGTDYEEILGDEAIEGTISGSRSSGITKVHHAGFFDFGVFSNLAPLMVPSEWDGNVLKLCFFQKEFPEEIWDLVKLVADHMIISSAIKNEVETTP